MRGFTTDRDRDREEARDKYVVGFIGGILFMIFMLVSIHAVELALENSVVAEARAWATTPQFTPIDVVGMVALLLLVGMIWLAASLGPRR